MPNPCYMTIKGRTQGLISAGAMGEASMGSKWQKDHEDKIMVQAFNHGLSVPTGKSAGHRMHKPFVITKAFDKSSPLLHMALCDGEVLSLCRLEFYRTSANGNQEHFYTVEFKKAVVVGVDIIMPHCQDSQFEQFSQLEKISFSYQEILWKHETARTIGSDEWQGAAFD